ncbi:hypothetical protein OC846_005105 [Tilletia horrida]|uniref:Uncharacterized protein n=1 Tax=Tilletia horrida TaxID=155126 RepID=A0AAN6JPV0_9BASI|nr:hypothetical protein OC846_005105 [Tilletia horrida]
MESSFLPSRDLCPLKQEPSLAQTQAGLTNIAKALGVEPEPEIFYPASERDEDDDASTPEDAGDEFEMRHVRSWLTRVVASDLDWLYHQHDEDANFQASREAAVTRAAELLAVCAGKSASGQSQVRYCFETPSGLISVRSRETTMSQDALGGRTWGAAPLLIRHLLQDTTTMTQLASSSPVRILELGAGTGLVGLALVLAVQDRSHLHLILTDHHPTVLSNLEVNISLNALDSPLDSGSSNSAAKVQVRRLDWQVIHDARLAGSRTEKSSATSKVSPVAYSSKAQTLPEGSESALEPRWLEEIGFENNSVDIIIAAECVYDPLHPVWVRSVAEKYLRKPEGDGEGQDRGGVMHMITANRRTHNAEMNAIYEAFPSPPSSLEDAQGKRPRLGAEARLVMDKVEQVSGYDDFGPPRLRLGAEANGPRLMSGTRHTYRRFEVRWAARP